MAGNERALVPVSDELNVLLHELLVHADEAHGKSVADELLLTLDSVPDDAVDGVLGELVLEVRVQQAGKVAVEALVAGDELVGEGEPGHEAALLEPEDGAEGTGKENSLNGREGHQALRKGIRLVDPVHGPLGLLLDAWDGRNGVEEVSTHRWGFDVRIDEEGIRFAVDVLNGNLG